MRSNLNRHSEGGFPDERGEVKGNATSDILVSFIIPAKNEEKHIGGTIDAIRGNFQGRVDYEITVVDNGSTDRTVEIAKKRGARVLTMPDVTISALRNAGAAVSSSDILAFVDADVELKDTWGDRIGHSIRMLEEQPLLVTGSTYEIEDEQNWIERFWYKAGVGRTRGNYINGGHLLVARRTFEQIGGFDERLRTGEDYDFCMRVRAIGGVVIDDERLEVVHRGNPKSLGRFFERERWHGIGDYESLRRFVGSKPAVISVIVWCMLILILLGIVWFRSLWLNVLLLSTLMFICIAAAVKRCGLGAKKTLVCSILYFVYFAARGVSLVDVVLGRKGGRTKIP